jgi:hypothetical protein
VVPFGGWTKSEKGIAMNTYRRFAVVVILSLILASVCHAHEGENAVLTGLKYVVVSMSDLKPEIEKDGLKKSQLQADVELKLRTVGIDVLSIEAGLQKAAPLFHTEINIIKTTVPIACGEVQKDIIMYSGVIMIQLKEPVKVIRTATSEGVTTWSQYVFGATGQVSDIRNRLKSIMDDFVKAWLYSNTKKQHATGG